MICVALYESDQREQTWLFMYSESRRQPHNLFSLHHESKSLPSMALTMIVMRLFRLEPAHLTLDHYNKQHLMPIVYRSLVLCSAPSDAKQNDSHNNSNLNNNEQTTKRCIIIFETSTGDILMKRIIIFLFIPKKKKKIEWKIRNWDGKKQNIYKTG